MCVCRNWMTWFCWGQCSPSQTPFILWSKTGKLLNDGPKYHYVFEDPDVKDPHVWSHQVLDDQIRYTTSNVLYWPPNHKGSAWLVSWWMLHGKYWKYPLMGLICPDVSISQIINHTEALILFWPSKSLNQLTQGSITSSEQLNRQTETQVLLSLVLWFIYFKSWPLSSMDSKQWFLYVTRLYAKIKGLLKTLL